MAVMRPELIMKSVIPVVMAGIIAIYGLVVAVVLSQSVVEKNYTFYKYVYYTHTQLKLGVELKHKLNLPESVQS